MWMISDFCDKPDIQNLVEAMWEILEPRVRKALRRVGKKTLMGFFFPVDLVDQDANGKTLIEASEEEQRRYQKFKRGHSYYTLVNKVIYQLYFL